jgi:penicillin-binding protein 2
MNQNAEIHKSFTRRAFVVGVAQLGILGVLAGRLAWLQIVQGNKYKTLSEENRIDLKILTPSRGLIYDRKGVPLAINGQNFRVVVVPEQAEDVEKSLRKLAQQINLPEEDIQLALKQVKRNPKFVPVEVKNDVNWDEVAKIEVNLPDLPGISIDVGKIRKYPFAESTAHLIGYVGAVNKSELTGNPVLNLPGFKIGKTGLEKSLDLNIRGQAGTSHVEVNVYGREIRELKRDESVQGDQITLTIDSDLQEHTQKLLAQHRSASAVVMDIHSGEVYALASHPAFDPNVFSRGIPTMLWEQLLADETLPLTNKAVAGQYPPGSTFKMVTALAGMQAGVIDHKQQVYCPGHFELGQARFHCWKKGGHGSMNVIDALCQSCDTYFYQLARDIGIDKIAQTARLMGLGSKFDFDIAEERPGLIPDQQWKLGRFGEKWHPGETVVASIGQGYLLTTPLQLAVMTSRLVNGGYAVEPWITGYVGEEDRRKKIWPKMNIDDAHLAVIKTGMDMVVNYERGTAYGSRIDDPLTGMGGKTGTSQVRRITAQQRAQGVNNADLPWNQRHHGLFVGYAPYLKPQYACAVVVEHGVGGSSSAAPIARDILKKILEQRPGDITLAHAEKQTL